MQRNYRMVAQAQKQSIYTRQFMMLCLSTMLFFTSFNLIIPELPDFLTKMGGADYKGYIISLFTLTAGLSRPFSGKLADTIGRLPVMIFGALVCFVSSLLYPFATTIFAFFLLRFFHGMSTGFKPTATTAYIADIVPAQRRGEAMGLIGLFNSMGMAIGPFLGSKIAASLGLDILFYISSAMGLLSVLVLAGMKETLPKKQSFSPKLLAIKPNEIIDPKVLPAAVVMLFTTFSFGAILTLIPDFSIHIGLAPADKGIFFSVYTLSSFGIRFLAGKISDKIKRTHLLKVSTTLIALAMIYLSTVTSYSELLIAGALFGISVGINSPTAFAWTIDLSNEKHRGRGMATLYIALETGIGIGAYSSGSIFDNNAANFKYAFWVGAFLSFIAFLFLIVHDFIANRKEKNVHVH